MHTQVYAQNQELRTQLKESKRNEEILLEQINKAKQKMSDLHKDYNELKVLSSGKEIETQLSIMRRKMNDVKSEFGNIDVIKIHCIEEVKVTKYKNTYACVHCTCYM